MVPGQHHRIETQEEVWHHHLSLRFQLELGWDDDADADTLGGQQWGEQNQLKGAVLQGCGILEQEVPQ